VSQGRHGTSEHASRCRVADADRSGCDWGQGDRRFSAGQPARATADWQSPRSSSRRMCRTRPYLTGGYPASSAVSEDGRRTVCWLACFYSVRAVIDLWARRQDGFRLHSEWLRSSRRRPAHSSRRGAGPHFSSARADGLGRSPGGRAWPELRRQPTAYGFLAVKDVIVCPGPHATVMGALPLEVSRLRRAGGSLRPPARNVPVIHRLRLHSGR
jgi:hypothetical protein